jgi:hypothetical protein
MDAAAELQSLLTGGSRVIVVADKEVDLRPSAADNLLFLLKVAEGSLAAGGRGGGFGERRVVLVASFRLSGGGWSKTYETSDESLAAGFEVPYYVSRIPMFLPDGTEAIGYGVVDPELVAQMLVKSEGLSSA